MKFFQKVLAKAEKEGKLSPGLIPWETEADDKDNPAEEKQPLNNIFQKINISPAILTDCQNLLATISKPGKLTGISAVLPRQGNSSLCLLLSLLASQSGKKVLLIDAHTQSPRLHRFFTLDIQPGFVNAACGEQPLQSVLNSFPDRIPDVITAGEKNVVKKKVIRPEYLSEQLSSLRSAYDYIIFDLPPVLNGGANFDIAPICDHVILSVGITGVTQRKMIKARKQLENAGVNILGAVLNRQQINLPNQLTPFLQS